MGRSKSRGWVSRIASVGFVLLLLGPARGVDVDTLEGLVPAETFVAGNVPTFNGRDYAGIADNVDKLDVTWTATVDFSDKVDGDPEVIFETGGSGTGLACIYEAGNVVAVIKSGGGNQRAEFALPPFLVDGGAVSLAWTCNPDSPQRERSIGLIVQGFLVDVDVGRNTSNDWSGGNQGGFGTSQGTVAQDVTVVDFTSGTLASDLAVHVDTHLVPATTDSDGDGLADEWESLYSADLATLGGGDMDDADMDGLIDRDEFANLSSPILADTDGDGIDDGEEIALGTSPTSTDSDGDGVPDGEELTQGLDPANPDTDGDAFSDGVEIGGGSDPNDPDSIPAEECGMALPAEPTEVRQTLGAFQDYQNTQNDGMADVDGDGARDHAARYERDDATFRVLIDFEPKPAGRRELIWETGNGTVGFSLVYEIGNVLVLRASGGGLSLVTIGYPLAANLVTGGDVEVTWSYNVDHASIETVRLMVEGVTVGIRHEDLGGDWSNTNNASFGEETGSFAGAGQDSNLRGDDFTSGAINLETGLLFWSGVALCPATTDSDGDGLADEWEGLYSNDLATLGGGDADADGDDVSDTDEFKLGSNPTSADTDGDGLPDGDELAGGTSPLSPDSDADGRLDSDEINGDPATDPLNPDTDGDVIFDGPELVFGSDPTDPLSVPSCVGLTLDDCPDAATLPPQDCVTELTAKPTEVRTVGGAFQDYQNTQGGGTADVDGDGVADHDGRFDLRDATFTAVVDFDPKSEGEREVIWESGGGTFGASLTYEAPSRLVLRVTGSDGLVLLTVVHELTQAQLDGGELDVAWSIDVEHGTVEAPDPADPPVVFSTAGLFVDGEPVASASGNIGGDWSGTNNASFGTQNSDVTGTGRDSGIPAVDFASGAINLNAGLVFYADTVLCSPPPGVGLIPGDANFDGRLDLSDGIRLLQKLFTDVSAEVPCPGAFDVGGNRATLNFNGDATVDLSDAVGIFTHLFLDTTVVHVLGTDCVLIADCERASVCAVQ